MMTFEEYNEEINSLSDKLLDPYRWDEWEKNYEKLSEFQEEHMTDFLMDYKSKIDNEAKEYIYKAFEYAVHNSFSGSSIIEIPTKELADEIEDITWNEIGEYLLDYEVYEEDDHFVLDAIFGGNYVPYWDGWQDLV